MRSEIVVQDRIRFLLAKELDSRVAKACARLPRNCKHNHRQPLDIRKKIEGEDGAEPNANYNLTFNPESSDIGFCMINSSDPTEWAGDICEDQIDAQRCERFDLISTRESINDGFTLQIKDLDWVAENLPEVYGLLWALGSETLPSLPWWKALWFRFLRIRPDPLITPPPTLPAP
jgi:hypothetical protein